MFGYRNRPISEHDLTHDENSKKQVSISSESEELVPDLINDVVTLIFSFLPEGTKKVPDVSKSWYLDWLRSIQSIRDGYGTPFSPRIIKNMRNLTVLSGRASNFTDEIISDLRNLTVLNLSFNKHVTDKGIANLKKLTTLDLESQRWITDDALIKLPNLTSLNLNDNQNITKKTLDHFAQQLTKLSLFGNQLYYHVFNEIEVGHHQETRYDSSDSSDYDDEGYEVTVHEMEKVVKAEFPVLNTVSYGFEPSFYGWKRPEEPKQTK